jgi:hypothetical protein
MRRGREQSRIMAAFKVRHFLLRAKRGGREGLLLVWGFGHPRKRHLTLNARYAEHFQDADTDRMNSITKFLDPNNLNNYHFLFPRYPSLPVSYVNFINTFFLGSPRKNFAITELRLHPNSPLSPLFFNPKLSFSSAPSRGKLTTDWSAQPLAIVITTGEAFRCSVQPSRLA